MEFLRKYGVAAEVYVPLIKAGSNDQALAADFTHVAGDTTVVKNGGAAANITTAPTALAMGNGATWKVALSATEMQAAEIVVNISDAATKAIEDQQIVISTYGNASAEHAFDLDTASVAQTGDAFARLGAPAAASIAADLLAIDNFVDELESRLTAARAGYLDNLSAGAVALASVCTAGRLGELDAANLPADIDTLIARLTAARATNLDNLDAAITAIMTTQMTEAYAADGVAPTPAQALFFIQQILSEFAISGVTFTGKKIDGTTTAFTLTLDDAASPTSITRAT